MIEYHITQSISTNVPGDHGEVVKIPMTTETGHQSAI
jgi:hypothetical protein